jgi:hypothetical protein
MKLFFFAAFLFSIASGAATQTLHFNPELVRPWSKELSASEPFPYPYLATFKRNGFVLTYVAANHENQESSPTMALIRRALEKSSAQAVMIEGFPFDAPRSDRESFLRYAERTRRGGVLEGGEDAYAAILAHSKGLPFYGGEANDSQILKGVLAHGYSARDLVGFDVLKMIPVWTRNGKLKSEPLEKLAKDNLRYFCRNYRLPSSRCPDYHSFEIWYRTKNGKAFGKDFDDAEVAPFADGGYFTQRISAAVSAVRNRVIVQHIGALLLKHEEILVVYGGSHLAMQTKAFEEALGTPVYSR